jgi:hypothetical protein
MTNQSSKKKKILIDNNTIVNLIVKKKLSQITKATFYQKSHIFLHQCHLTKKEDIYQSTKSE